MPSTSKFRGADSTPAGSIESPHLEVPASNSDENRVVGTSFVPGNKLFQQNWEPSTQMQSQLSQKVSTTRARKTFPNSKNNIRITQCDEKDPKNLGTVPLSTNGSKLEPVANADSTSTITMKGAICQESPPTFTPQQLEQSRGKQLKTTLAQQNQYAENATSLEKDKGPFAENFQPPTPPKIEDRNVETIMTDLHGEPLEIAQEAIDDFWSNNNDEDAILTKSDFESTPEKADEPSRPFVKKSASEAKPSREVEKLLQDEGAARIMQEMKGKGTNKRRSTASDKFYGEGTFYFPRERSIVAKKKK